jgi:glycerophosphoryl diester phosphodiesterase
MEIIGKPQENKQKADLKKKKKRVNREINKSRVTFFHYRMIKRIKKRNSKAGHIPLTSHVER